MHAAAVLEDQRDPGELGSAAGQDEAGVADHRLPADRGPTDPVHAEVVGPALEGREHRLLAVPQLVLVGADEDDVVGAQLLDVAHVGAGERLQEPGGERQEVVAHPPEGSASRTAGGASKPPILEWLWPVRR